MPFNKGLKVCSFNAKLDLESILCKKSCSPLSVPSSLLASLIAINILSSDADIYNLQNVPRCVVDHLAKEICRVHEIMKNVDDCNTYSLPSGSLERVAFFKHVACQLNDTAGLCEDALDLKDSLLCKKLRGLDYVSLDLVDPENTDYETQVLRYKHVAQYKSYFESSCLTLVKSNLCIEPEVCAIPCVDSLVLVFVFNGQKFVNVNLNMGDLIASVCNLQAKKAKVQSVVSFLKSKYSHDAVIMTGAFGDVDHDVSQLLFRGDAVVPEIAQKLLSGGHKVDPVPSDFPCDLNDSVYEIFDFLMKNCKSENIPYAWLLQYIRLHGHKVNIQSCKTTHRGNSVHDCIKCPTPVVLSAHNRSAYRTHVKSLPKNVCGNSCSKGCKCNKCDTNQCKPKKCAEKCKCPTVCDDKCKDFEYCDTLSLLKRELSLTNSLSKVSGVNNRFTEFSNHFNRALDCKFPRGIFQALACGKDYEFPCPTRTVDNNAELLALDHFLVSDCIKHSVAQVCLSDLYMEKCGKDVKEWIKAKEFNALNALPHTTLPHCMTGLLPTDDYVFQYAGSIVKSVFTHRMYCVSLDFPSVDKDCKVKCSSAHNDLGRASFWSALTTVGSNKVSIKMFEKFGLDKHPYFRKYFWKSLKKLDHGATETVTELMLNELSCKDTSVVSIRKAQYICEDEFYELLNGVHECAESHERFVTTIAFMESLYRVDRMRELMPIPALDILDNKDIVNDLFVLLSVCFKHQLDLNEYLESVGLSVNVIANIDLVGVQALIDALGVVLKNNNSFIEILVRHVYRLVKVVSGMTAEEIQESPFASIVTNSLFQSIVLKYKCNKHVDQDILNYVNTTGAHSITVLLFILNGVSLPVA